MAGAASWSSAVVAAVVGTGCAAPGKGICRSFFVAGPSAFVDEFEFLATISAGRAMKDFPTGRRERVRFFDMILVLVDRGGGRRRGRRRGDGVGLSFEFVPGKNDWRGRLSFSAFVPTEYYL